MLKEALQYLISLGEVKTLEINGQTYATKDLDMVSVPKPSALVTTTLTAMVDYLKTDMDKKYSERLLIHVKAPDEVVLYSELRGDADREIYMKCEALTPDINFEKFIDTEKFNIMLQSSFVRNEDCSILLQVVGNVKDEAVKETGDDGVTQVVTMKTGVAQVQPVKVPNPVALAPFRTFPEIDQVESKFIFRMQEGPKAAIFEADGGAWRNETMARIKSYLEEQLQGLNNIKVIS